MYKKITHDIVEEHFEHPMTLPKEMLDRSALAGASDKSLPDYVMNENTMLVRMNSRSAWAKWVWSLLNYSISLNGNLSGTEQVKGRMHKNAVALGDFLIPYYGLTASRAITTAILAIDDVGMHYVDAIKKNATKEEIDVIVASWTPYIVALARAMNELNPNYWPETLLSDIFTNLVAGWVDELAARARGDIIANEIAIDYLNKLVVTGVHAQSTAGFSSLADIFSYGIIAQFPAMFTY